MDTPLRPERGPGLDWLAFRYLVDELTVAEVEQFERQLAGDQAAREAVARAVRLVELIGRAEQLGPPVSCHVATAADRGGRGVWRWVLWGVAAGLCGVLLYPRLAAPPKAGPGARSPAAMERERAGELALAWCQVREGWNVTFDDEVAAPLDVAESSRGPAGDRFLHDQSTDEVAPIATPSWMLDAVAGLAGLALTPGDE
jgi:hypothetical protein